MCDDDTTADRKMRMILSMMREARRKPMDPKMAFLKERLKTLGELQTKTKRARKTTLPEAEWKALKEELAPKKAYWDHSVAASDARLRKVEITACLNLYHELRGSEYRHAGEGYWYDKAIQALRTELDKI